VVAFWSDLFWYLWLELRLVGLEMNLAKLRDHARGRTGHRRGVYRYTLIRFGGFQDCEIKRFEDLLHRGKATTDFIDGMPSLTTTSYVLDRRAQGELPLHVLDGRARALIDKGRGPETLFVVMQPQLILSVVFPQQPPETSLVGGHCCSRSCRLSFCL